MNHFIDIILGKMVFIGDSFTIGMMLNYREFVDKEVKNDWIIAYQMNYTLGYKMINKKHPKHKQIVKLINNSIEHGITTRRNRLLQHGFLLFYYLFERFVHSKIVDMIKGIIHKKQNLITMDQFESVFMLLLLILSISAIVLILEVIWHKIKFQKIIQIYLKSLKLNHLFKRNL